jgi:hypothetical protein
MFATQHYMETFSDVPKKRGREDGEELGTGALSFSEHRNKRIQSLPFRTSPKAAQQLLPTATITPLNAPPGSLTLEDHAAGSFEQHPQQPDDDMDMSDSLGPMLHPNTARIAHGHEGVNATTRMPTPIQPSFAAQVRGHQCEWAGPQPTGPTVNGVVNLGHHQTGLAKDQCVPRIMAGEADWQTVQNNRRLPSPISECDDTAAQSCGMPGDDHCHGQLSAQMENSTISSLPPSPHSHHHGTGDNESADGDAESPGPSPSRRGHMRSKHTINTWTWQPGMKRSFSIGYRADCEKCRLKVPGHFNHIIIS